MALQNTKKKKNVDYLTKKKPPTEPFPIKTLEKPGRVKCWGKKKKKKKKTQSHGKSWR